MVDSHGDIGASAGGPDGLFHNDTRFLSRLELRLNGVQPLLLGSNVRDDNTLLAVDLTNPDIFAGDHIVLHKDTCTSCARFSCGAAPPISASRCAITATAPVEVALSLRFGNDFADLFEVRGERRARRGTTSHRVIDGTTGCC